MVRLTSLGADSWNLSTCIDSFENAPFHKTHTLEFHLLRAGVTISAASVELSYSTLEVN
jgi:hypothetical protein